MYYHLDPVMHCAQTILSKAVSQSMTTQETQGHKRDTQNNPVN